MLYFIVLTQRCNLKCIYCGNEPLEEYGPENAEFNIEELTGAILNGECTSTLPMSEPVHQFILEKDDAYRVRGVVRLGTINPIFTNTCFLGTT